MGFVLEKPFFLVEEWDDIRLSAFVLDCEFVLYLPSLLFASLHFYSLFMCVSFNCFLPWESGLVERMDQSDLTDTRLSI